MELRRLKCFVEVAECMHFGRAAERLNVVQSAISQQIKLLEKELGVELLERSRHHVELTEAGRLFLSEARRVLLQADRAAQIAREASAGKIGRLNLGCVDNALWSPLPSVLRAFRERYPDVEISLYTLDRVTQIKALEDRTIDIGIFPSPRPGAGFGCELFVELPFVAAIPSNHRLASQPRLRLEALANDPFVLFAISLHTRIVEIIMSACAGAGFIPKVTQEAYQLSTLLGLVSAGLGVTLVPRWVASPYPADVLYRELELPPSYELVLAWWEGTTSNIVENFRQTVEAVVGAGERARTQMPPRPDAQDLESAALPQPQISPAR